LDDDIYLWGRFDDLITSFSFLFSFEDFLEDFLEDFFAFFVRDILTFWLVDSDFYEKSSSNGYFALLEA